MSEFKIIFPDDAKQIAMIFQKHNFELYAVGGVVRDSIIAQIYSDNNITQSDDSDDMQYDDIDFTTNAHPNAVMELFKHTIPTGLQHGTVTIRFHGKSYEVTTYRIDEKYINYRKPESVQFSSSLEEDLARRDFTINAIAANPHDGDIVAPFSYQFSGVQDIREKLIRCVGVPLERFTEDALRMLRAIRFATKLGFEIERETFSAICTLHANIQHISKERIQTELRKTLCSSSPARGITLLHETGLLEYIITDTSAQHIIQRLSSIASPQHIALGSDEEIIRLSLCFSLTRDRIEVSSAPFILRCHQRSLDLASVLKTLKFPNKTIQKIQFLVSRTHYIRQENSSFYVRISRFQLSILLSKYGLESCQSLMEYLQAILVYYQNIFSTSHTHTAAKQTNSQAEKKAEKQLVQLSSLLQDPVFLSQSIPKQSLSIKGNYIAEVLHKKEGKWLGVLMGTLHRFVLAHPEKNNETDLLIFARKTFQNSCRQT